MSWLPHSTHPSTGVTNYFPLLIENVEPQDVFVAANVTEAYCESLGSPSSERNLQHVEMKLIRRASALVGFSLTRR